MSFLRLAQDDDALAYDRYLLALTCLAVVAGVQIGGEVFRTWLDQFPNARHRKFAAPPTGAGAIQQVRDVSRAAEEAVVT